MASTFKGDATTKQFGHFYQYFVALECCLNAQEGETIYLENRGDVANDKTVYEVKHHIQENHILSERHVDFWKTLKNWVENRQLFKDYDYLILLTTSHIEKGSRFDPWNSLDKEDKFELLKQIVQDRDIETIKPFVKTIFTFTTEYTREDLLDILDRFKIQYSQERIQEKIQELENHQAFKIIPKKNRRYFIFDLIGNKIVRKGIERPQNWEIHITEFNGYFISQGRKYCDTNIPLPTVYKKEAIADEKPYQNRRFVQELYKIDYKKQVLDAINDYHKANQTVTLLCGVNQNLNVGFVEAIEDYQENLLRDLGYTKDQHVLECQSDEVKERQKHSKRCYIKCLGWPLKQIEGISQNEDFFQRGIIHQIVEDEKHSWLIEQEDIV